MREILFKAKRTDNGEWITGGICQSSDGKTYIVGVSKRGYIDGLEVKPETICQYTGLKDKNGNKIWENDVVKDNNGNVYKAFWREKYYQFLWECVAADSLLLGAKWDLWCLPKNTDLQVIGNRFDQGSELLNGN